MYVQIQKRPNFEQWHIKRPERRNALGTSIGNELLSACEELKKRLESNSQIRALVISAETQEQRSQPVWIAGGDLKELAQLKSSTQGRNYAKALSQVCAHLEAMPVPVICAIDGAAIGGAAEFALAADLRIATRRSRLEFKQLQIGLATGYGGTRRLVSLIGKSHAQRLLLTCANLSAEQALMLGLFHFLEPDQESQQRRVASLIEHFANLEPSALSAQKQMLEESDFPLKDRAYQKELEIFSKIWMNPTHKSFLERFEKRSTS